MWWHTFEMWWHTFEIWWHTFEMWWHTFEMWWHTRRNQLSSFGRNGRVHLNRRGESVQSTNGSRVVRISFRNAGYTTFRGIMKGTSYPLHSSVSPSLLLPCVTVCHHVSTGLYYTACRHTQYCTKRPNTYSSQGLKFYHLANTSVLLPCFKFKNVGNLVELRKIPTPYTKYRLTLRISVVLHPMA